MQRPFHFFLVAFSSLCAACAPSCEIKNQSQGDMGNASFQYSGTCFLDCSLDSPALAGSKVTVVASADRAKGVTFARVTPDGLGKITGSTPSCDTSCALSIDIETAHAGEGAVEVLDAKGSVVDRTPFHVHDAARIDLSVEDDDSHADISAKGDTYEIAPGRRIGLRSRVFDAGGTSLVWTEHGLAHAYADRTILAPNEAVIVGSTDVEDMVAVGAGETTVTVRAGSASATAKFRVVR